MDECMDKRLSFRKIEQSQFSVNKKAILCLYPLDNGYFITPAGIVNRMRLQMIKVVTTKNRQGSSKTSSQHHLLRKDMRGEFKRCSTGAFDKTLFR